MRITAVTPWPPSANNLKIGHGKRLISSPKARAFYDLAADTLADLAGANLRGKLFVRLDLYPPDRRRRDIANFEKAPIDALVKNRVIEDDSNIEVMMLTRQEPDKGNARVVVTITALDDKPEGESK